MGPNPARDTNIRIAGLLGDLAAVQTSVHSKWGYKRAAAAILALEEPIEALILPDGSLRKIPGVGPSSSRIIFEVLQTGGSPTVERAVAESTRAADVERSRGLRAHFLSRAQVVAALGNRTFDGPALSDYLGDLQLHSEWSDGADTLDDIAHASIARGYRYCAVTDHSYGLPIARGVSMIDLTRQHQEIDRLNRKHGPHFRILKGIEANIRADGSVDMAPEELDLFDIVVAAPHSALRSQADQTIRMLAAVATRGVHILGHPRGRMFGSRAGVAATWPRVFEAAARRGVAIELDGDPSRQDLDHTLAREAIGSGCLFALNSDAHAAAELVYAETALAHARLAGIPAERIVNCWPLERLLDWARNLAASTTIGP
jgi:putative hydrolase